MSKDVVLCLNLQVGYLGKKGTSYIISEFGAEFLKKRTRSELNQLDKNKYEIIYSRNIRSPEDPFYSHCITQNVVGTLDVQLISGLPSTKSMLVAASRPSAMHMSPLKVLILKQKPEKVYLVGVPTSSAILFTACDLKSVGFDVRVVEPLTVDKDKYIHNAAITVLADTLGVKVVGSIGD